MANSILIKLNQIGTVTRDDRGHRAGPPLRLHRGHLAIERGDGRHASSPTLRWPPARGRSRPDRPAAPTASAKYNQLLRIEEELGEGAEFLGIESLNFQ